jgi:hypothetical protein
VHADLVLPVESFIIYACKCIVHLRIGFEWKLDALEWLPFYVVLVNPLLVVHSTVSCAMLSSS